MTTREVYATGRFEITVDESKFTPEFFAEFQKYMFYADCVDDVIEHLSGLFARGVIDGSTDFIEGYGPPADFGIKFVVEGGGNAWIDNTIELEINNVAEQAAA